MSLTFVSREELGRDPITERISMVAFDRTRRCDITADEFDHRGVGVLSSYSADTIVKRGARMWKVNDASGTDYVLQDVWVETDCNWERGLREDHLRHSLEESDLLIPLGHWLVDVDGQVDHTAIITMYGQSFQKFHALVSKKLPGCSPFRAGDGAERENKAVRSKSSSRRPGNRKVSHGRKHCRIDSEEAATPLSSSLSDIFDALADIAEGMIWLWFS